MIYFLNMTEDINLLTSFPVYIVWLIASYDMQTYNILLFGLISGLLETETQDSYEAYVDWGVYTAPSTS